MPRLGAHMSIAGGVDRAILRGHSIGCEAIQIFTKSNNQWRAAPLTDDTLERFHANQHATGIGPIVGHDAYLINLASPDPSLWRKSVDAFVDEMERAGRMGLPYLVTHPGAHTGAGEDVGVRRVAQALDEIHERTAHIPTMILLETTAGAGSTLGGSFEQLAEIIARTRHPERVGICFDTSHAFAAGYDLRTPETYAATFEAFDRILGLHRLRVFHLNDSKRELGSRVDRHDHIGRGFLGLEAFRLLLNDPRFANRPMILETPKGPDMAEDVENLRVLRSLMREPPPAPGGQG
ncbi:MAG: deoxyribonuclease IV [Anaerolineae bacterium]|jgi:deoxyribonuclease-4|nr:deoxyribonuclease IV [Anaerolineae bacterium]